MKIEKGLFDNMVLQRNKANASEAEICVRVRKPGLLKAAVTRKGKEVPGCRLLLRKSTEEQLINACLTGIPTGGPYDIRLTLENTTGKSLEEKTVENVLVGDVWLLAGQSNMEGLGYLKDALPPQDMARAFYMTDQWGTAKDPMHLLYKAVDGVHTAVLGAVKPSSHAGVGPGVSFAQEMHRLSGVPQGLIACAHGGTSMSQWAPALKDQGSMSLYGAMVRRFEKNGGKAAGVVWYQGCSDADENAAPLYTGRMVELVEAMRKDFGNSKLPVAAVQIARVCPFDDAFNPTYWNSVQEQQRKLPEVIKNLSVVPAIDLALDDLIHLSGLDQARLGKRLALAMVSLASAQAEVKPQIRLKGIKTETDRYSGNANIIITYGDVEGKLEASGRPTGFSLIDRASGINRPCIYRTDLSGNKVILKTGIVPQQAETLDLHYGYGIDPYCNITDSKDRSLPVMGPISLNSSVKA